ncbi:contractile injection system tape measure protein [Aquimarina longa]|uniref:contractile injection system tape measure protein n=1 Tax=Aquimarina longa TaxID=1080221 RepID=UPI00078582C8|nr:contractile injection system tape measure protein [Aquimarina longa]
MTQQHLIGKQTIELEARSSKDAYVNQQKISQLVWKNLVPALENLFDNLVAEDEVIQLDTIAIDIGAINLDRPDISKIVDKIIELLEKTLQEELTSINFQKNIKRDREKNNKNTYKFLNSSDIHKNGNPHRGSKDKSNTNSFKDTINTANQVNSNNNNFFSEKGNISEQAGIKRKRQPIKAYYFQAWLYWLEKGTLPSYVIPPEDDWMLLVLETLGVDIQAVTVLENKLKIAPIALQRLVVQHTPKDLKSIVELYTGFSQDGILDFFKEIKTIQEKEQSFDIPIFSITIPFRTLEINIWKKIFEIISIERKKIDSSTLARQVIRHLRITNIINEVSIKKIVSATNIYNENNKQSYPFLSKIYNHKQDTDIENEQQTIAENKKDIKSTQLNKNTTEEKKKEYLKKIKKDKGEHIDKEAENKTQEHHQEESIVKDTSVVKETKEEISKDEIFEAAALESPQFFNNAGVVLLNPFLSNFFSRLNLLEDSDFKDINARSKAVVLLHYLATGEEDPKEYEMILPKFLCEMPVNIPLDHTICLTKEEKKEANDLLAVIVEHWGALGSISADGLREGFLIRQGKLEKEQTGWKLYVEQKTLDILLDKLPWNLSLIKLPWMKEMLKVEWR